MVENDLDAGRLVAVLAELRRAEIGIYALFLPRQPPAHLRAFVDFLAAWYDRPR